MRHPRRLLYALLPALALAVLLAAPGVRSAATFTVNTTGDTSDASAGDGVCDDGAGNCTLPSVFRSP